MTNPINTGSVGSGTLSSNSNNLEDDNISTPSNSASNNDCCVIEIPEETSEPTSMIQMIKSVTNRYTILCTIQAALGLTTALATASADSFIYQDDIEASEDLCWATVISSGWSILSLLSAYASVGYNLCKDNGAVSNQAELSDGMNDYLEQNGSPLEEVERNAPLPLPSGVGADSDSSSNDGFDFDFEAYAKAISSALPDPENGEENEGFEPDEPQPGTSGISFIQVHSGGGHINPVFEPDSSDNEYQQDELDIIQIPLRRSRKIIFTREDDSSLSSLSFCESDPRSEDEGDDSNA